MQTPHFLIAAALSCVVAALPLRAADLNDLTWTTTGGQVTITDCVTSASGDLVIPATIEGLPVTTIGNNAFRSCDILSSIAIPDSVSTIGSRAFQFCDSLTSMVLPDGISSIASYTFYGCTRLASVTIPNSVISIGSRAFQECALLPSIVIPDGVLEIASYVFYRCTSLIDITIPDSVTTIGEQAFQECESLPTVVIPNSISTIPSRAFYGCTRLTSVTLPASITTIETYAFQGCADLPGIVIPDSVTSIGAYAFQNCTSLIDITIPDGITTIESRAFQYCERLPTVVLPDSISNIASYAFYGCTTLTSITFQGTAPSVGDSAFNNVPAGATAYVYEQFAGSFGGIGSNWEGFTVEALSGFNTVGASIVLGSGSVVGTGTYESGSSVTLTAVPEAGYAFLSWSGDAAGTANPLTLVLDTDKDVEVIFVEQSSYDGVFNAGRETVTSDPASHGLVTQASYEAVVAERDARFTGEQIRAMSADYTIARQPSGTFKVKINFLESPNLVTFAPFPVDPAGVSVVDGKICLEFTSEDEAAFFRFRVE